MSALPIIFLIFVTAYATRLRRGHQYASAMRPDSSEQCIELNSTTTAGGANTLSGDNHFNAPPQRRFRFHPNAHFAIEWILNPLSRDRFQMRRNHKFTAAPKDEVENPVIATEHLGNISGNDLQGDAVADEGGGGQRAAEEDEDADRVDFAVDENRSSIVTSLQSPMSRRWSVSGGRRFTRGITRSSSVAVLQEISNQDIPESLAI